MAVVAVITGVSAHPFRLPMKGALNWGKGSALRALEHVLVKVHAKGEAGEVIGVAEAPVRPTIYGETVASVQRIVAWLEPRLTGLALEDEAGIWDALHSVANNHTARGALDIAVHDARAKARGQTLFETWRGPNEAIRPSFILGIADIDTVLAEARQVFEQGVSVFKVKSDAIEGWMSSLSEPYTLSSQGKRSSFTPTRTRACRQTQRRRTWSA